MNLLYKLDENGEPMACESVLEWAAWMQTCERKIALTEVQPGIFVSTVFLGVDHGNGVRSPVLWETVVWATKPDGDLDWDRFDIQRRYSSQASARSGHDEIVERVKTLLARSN